MTILLFFTATLYGVAQSSPTLKVKKATDKIVIDGNIDELSWTQADSAINFYQHYPSDSSYATTKTIAKCTYDDNYLYIAAICYEDNMGDIVIESLKRDFSYPISDAMAVFLDPFNDHLNGFSFAVNPLGVQREGLVQGGGTFGVTTAWDNKWYSEVKQHNGYWTVEMAIPFKTIRFNPTNTEWGINFSRNNLSLNEDAAWSRVPKNFNVASLAFTGRLLWDKPPNKAGSNISIIPSAIGNINKDYQSGTATTFGGNAGTDAKIAVSSSLNLDLTINPDFSQVEVDQQVTNLSRFSIFYPERRQFFIENSDLFSEFGFSQIRPFFSRNIGLKDGTPVPILAGARLSGNLNKNWRIGLMNLQTEGVGNLNVEGQNYSVAAFQRRIWERSNIAGIFVNRQGFDGNNLNLLEYNRIGGLDFNLGSKDNKWIGKAFYHHSFYNGSTSSAGAHAVWLLYKTEKIFIMWNHEYVNKYYRADVGYVPRNTMYNPDSGVYENITYERIEPKIEYTFYPKLGRVYSHGPALYINNYYDQDFRSSDYFYMPHWVIQFRNTSVFQAHAHFIFTKLLYDYDVTNLGNAPLSAGNYYYSNYLLKFQSDKRQKFNYKLAVNYGGFYNGTKMTVSGDVNYRIQPWGVFAVNLEQNNIKLPDSLSDAAITLLGTTIQLSFNKNLFFTTFIQYNTQANNININSRLQWRFKPMSDLFIVYTENYNSYNAGIKNRALVVKFIYWLNL